MVRVQATQQIGKPFGTGTPGFAMTLHRRHGPPDRTITHRHSTTQGFPQWSLFCVPGRPARTKSASGLALHVFICYKAYKPYPVATQLRRSEEMPEPTLYERLGGVYAISAVVDYFSDQLVQRDTIEKENRFIKSWNAEKAGYRLPGLKF